MPNLITLLYSINTGINDQLSLMTLYEQSQEEDNRQRMRFYEKS